MGGKSSSRSSSSNTTYNTNVQQTAEFASGGGVQSQVTGDIGSSVVNVLDGDAIQRSFEFAGLAGGEALEFADSAFGRSVEVAGGAIKLAGTIYDGALTAVAQSDARSGEIVKNTQAIAAGAIAGNTQQGEFELGQGNQKTMQLAIIAVIAVGGLLVFRK